MKDLSLYSLPSNDWQVQYDVLMKDPYIASKYNRANRIQNKLKYIDDFLPELMQFNVGKVLDVGTGPGEFLEVCRSMGFDVFGLDAPIGQSEMGNEYLLLSKLMTERQQLKVYYSGVDLSVFRDGDFVVVNLQGAIEQIFKDYMIGVPHRYHKDASLLAWDIGDDLNKAMTVFLSDVYRILEDDGILMIQANGAKNTEKYDDMIVGLSEVIGFKVVLRSNRRIHKFKK